MDEIRRRLLTVNRDNRSPAMKVLDLIDAPATSSWVWLLRACAARLNRSGDTGAFGLDESSSVTFRATLASTTAWQPACFGFVGDVAFDPLTYVGPAGWGAEPLPRREPASPASVCVRPEPKVLRKEIANVAAGGLKHVADETAHAYLLAKGFTPERVAELVSTNGRAGAQSAIAKEVFGDPSKSILEKVFRPLGGEKTFEAASGNLASGPALVVWTGQGSGGGVRSGPRSGMGTGFRVHGTKRIRLRISEVRSERSDPASVRAAGWRWIEEVLHGSVHVRTERTVQVPAFTAKANKRQRPQLPQNAGQVRDAGRVREHRRVHERSDPASVRVDQRTPSGKSATSIRHAGVRSS